MESESYGAGLWEKTTGYNAELFLSLPDHEQSCHLLDTYFKVQRYIVSATMVQFKTGLQVRKIRLHIHLEASQDHSSKHLLCMVQKTNRMNVTQQGRHDDTSVKMV